MTILVAGGGIAGLTFALTCHELGLDVRVLEAAAEIKALGVGINLQPNAVRELYALGFEPQLRDIGIEAEEWALFYYGVHPVWREPRGTRAGYRWPQFSIHRGQFQMTLLAAVRNRLGEDAVVCDAQLLRYQHTDAGVRAWCRSSSGTETVYEGSLLVAADGIHSQVRQQQHPEQGEVHWNGAILWRGVSRYQPPLGKNAFLMVGGIKQRFICYPIEPCDKRGDTLLNWIAEIRYDPSAGVDRSDWNKPSSTDPFLSEFADWQFDWLDVPEIVSRASGIWEFPMVDREPLPSWHEQRVVLIGDAAHAMYPHGSNGASQAIVDARVLGAMLLRYGITEQALLEYEQHLLEPTNQLLLRARSEGPIGVLIDIEARLAAGATLDQAIQPHETAAFMAQYKEAAGFARDALNSSPAIVESILGSES